MQLLHNLVSSFSYLAAFGCLCIILQKLFPSNKSQKLWRKESTLDLTYWLVVNIFVGYITMVLASVMITLVAVYLSPSLLARLNAPEQAGLEIAGIILSVILLDFTAYWVHRAFHSGFLWKFHAIHHSSQELDWLSSIRFHPLEASIIIAITYSVCIIGGLGFKEVAFAILIRSAYGYLVHSNLSWSYGRAGYLIASPYFHRWHHTRDKEGLDKNFAGVFSLWDFIFGTAYLPKNVQPKNFGVGKDIGQNFWQQIIYPFR